MNSLTVSSLAAAAVGLWPESWVLLFSQSGLNQVGSKGTLWHRLSSGFCLHLNHLTAWAQKDFRGCRPNSASVGFSEGRACLACLVATFLKTITVSGLWVFRCLWKFMPLNVWFKGNNILSAFPWHLPIYKALSSTLISGNSWQPWSDSWV